jgi:polar amino acid transport system substrate-binding protein
MVRGIRPAVAIAVVVLVGVAALLAGIEVGKTVYGSSSSSKAQFLVVGTNIPFPPFEDFNATTGVFFGFDMDLAGMFANATHRTLVVDNYADFSILLATVGKGGIDMGASAITESGSVGALRNQSMSFSIPYYDANQAILVKTSSSFHCANPANCTQNDLKALVVGVQTGTTSQGWATTYLEPNMTNPSNLKNFTTVDTEVAALEAGSIDAVIIDSGPASSIAAGSSGALKAAGTIITGELYGFAVAHGDPEGLLPVINSVLSTAKSDGTYDKLIHKWFR